MRRNDRAVVEQERILAMVKKCSVCSLAFAGGAFPYVIPLNFGEKAADGKTVLYFHGAGEGIKFERLREDNRVAFSMYATEELVMKEPASASTKLYESVCGTGRAFVNISFKRWAWGIRASGCQAEAGSSDGPSRNR